MAPTDDAIEAAYMNVYFWKMACRKGQVLRGGQGARGVEGRARV